MITPHLRIGDVVDDGLIVIMLRRHPVHHRLEAICMRDAPFNGVHIAFAARGVATAVRRDLVAASRCWLRWQEHDTKHFDRARLARTRAIWGECVRRDYRNAQRIYDLHCRMHQEAA